MLLLCSSNIPQSLATLKPDLPPCRIVLMQSCISFGRDSGDMTGTKNHMSDSYNATHE